MSRGLRRGSESDSEVCEEQDPGNPVDDSDFATCVQTVTYLNHGRNQALLCLFEPSGNLCGQAASGSPATLADDNHAKKQCADRLGGHEEQAGQCRRGSEFDETSAASICVCHLTNLDQC